MPERKQVFLTGATGFIGSHLAYRLLQEGYRLSVLARGSKTMSARERVLDALGNAAETDCELQQHLSRLDVLDGDISLPRLGLSEETFKKILSCVEEVWHCAASLSFMEEDRDEIFRMNLDGTRTVLQLVEQTPSRRLHHVSTAYIAGKRTDVALETEIFVGQEFKNPYEESKCQAELLIDRAHQRGVAVSSVYRPAIVIGDSRSGRVTHFHGVYAFIRSLWAAPKLLKKVPGIDGFIHIPLRVLGAEKTTLNFVPVDYVVNAMVTIAKQTTSAGATYHLANSHPTENHFWLHNVSEILRVRGIQLVGESIFLKIPMTKLEAMFHKKMSFYYQYLCGEPRFDCRQTVEALKNTSIECPRVTGEFIHKMVGWYIGFLDGKIQGVAAESV